MSCSCERIVRLEAGGSVFWICTVCNAQFVPKAAVDWKMAHLSRELGGRLRNEQAARVRRQERISKSKRS